MESIRFVALGVGLIVFAICMAIRQHWAREGAEQLFESWPFPTPGSQQQAKFGVWAVIVIAFVLGVLLVVLTLTGEL